MKKNISMALLLCPAILFFLSCKDLANNTITGPEKIGVYKNGVYKGATKKDSEGYNASASIEVKQGFISTVLWSIYDNNLKRYFDSTYEQVYIGNPTYIQQCRDNMKGMAAYGPKLIQTQSIDSVDVITGATWTCWKFKEVVQIALKDAKSDSSGIK
jgi:major membrane immunogen (membrane-anchored lipoprotein)